MMRVFLSLLAGLTLSGMPLCYIHAAPVLSATAPAAPNGIEFPAGYQQWKLISSSHRTDKHSLRVILGNPIAIQAAQNKQTNPWPEGAILAKLVWKEKQHPDWAEAIVPGEFEHVEFMIKDSKKYQGTSGWGYARWLGTGLKPYGADANFAQECAACHSTVKGKDFVFTQPITLP